MFSVRNGIIVLALKSGITLMRTRPEALPRFSTATRTTAARRPLIRQLLPRRVTAPELHSPSLGGVCEASSRQSHNRTGRVAVAGARRTHRAYRCAPDRRPKTNASGEFESGEEQSPR